MNSWIFTPVFAKAAMLKQFLEHVYADKSNTEGFRHVILGNHYPVDEKENLKEIVELADKYGCIYIDSLYDRGLHDSLNNGMQILGVKANDIFLGADADDRPSTGAFQAIRKVMKADPTVGVCGLNFSVLTWKQKEQGAWPESQIAGERVWIHPGVEMFNIIGVNTKLIQAMGGFHQPNAYYGGIEVAMYQHWMRQGMKLVYLIDHCSDAVQVNREDPQLYDKSYGDWKIAHATKGYTGSYADWIKEHPEK